MTSRKVIKASLVMVLLVAVVGTWAALNATALRARYTARQLRAATDDNARARAADQLAGLGEHGLARLVEFVRAGDAPCRAAAAAAIDRRLTALPDDDPWMTAATDRLLHVMASSDEAGKHAILELLPAVLKRTARSHAAKCREAVAAGFRSSDPAVRELAVRLAIHPDLKMRAEVVPLLADPAAAVRCAALVAVAMPTDGEPLVPDEDLFRWLHDPDESVRKVCRGALVSRDRTETEIVLGWRLTNPDPTERLKLLLDLRYDNELPDPEPWLERLSRDIEPAVRAGAARVAVEVTSDRRLSCPPWVSRVADADPDPTVRRVASYFRSIPLRAAAGEFRPAGGP